MEVGYLTDRERVVQCVMVILTTAQMDITADGLKNKNNGKLKDVLKRIDKSNRKLKENSKPMAANVRQNKEVTNSMISMNDVRHLGLAAVAEIRGYGRVDTPKVRAGVLQIGRSRAGSAPATAIEKCARLQLAGLSQSQARLCFALLCACALQLF